MLCQVWFWVTRPRRSVALRGLFWIPAPRFHEDKLRGNDRLRTGGVLGASQCAPTRAILRGVQRGEAPSPGFWVCVSNALESLFHERGT